MDVKNQWILVLKSGKKKNLYECSECGYEMPSHDTDGYLISLPKYCPVCNAEMRNSD